MRRTASASRRSFSVSGAHKDVFRVTPMNVATVKIQPLSAVRTKQHSRKHAHFAHSRRSALCFSQPLHRVIGFSVYYRFVRKFFLIQYAIGLPGILEKFSACDMYIILFCFSAVAVVIYPPMQEDTSCKLD